MVFKNKNIFIIGTMGLFSGDGAGCGGRLLKSCGANIIGSLHLKMPDCIGDEKILKRPFEKNKKFVREAEIKILKSVNRLKDGKATKEGLGFFSHVAGFFGQRLWFGSKTKSYSCKLKVEDSKCVACGKCVAFCPMDNLRLSNKKVVAQNKCTMCYRCVNNCPEKAITLLGKKVFEQSLIEKYITE